MNKTENYVTRDGDTFTYHRNINGKTETEQRTLYHLMSTQERMYQLTENIVAGCSFLAHVLDPSKKKSMVEDLDEYQQRGIAGLLECMTDAYAYMTEERFVELQIFELAKVQP
jgi:hypothetical protein